MGKVPFRNDEDKPVYIGTVLVAPGDVKDVEEHDLPVNLTTEDESMTGEVTIVLLDGKAGDVISALQDVDDAGGSLFSNQDLAELLEDEEAGKNRSTVIQAIQAEILERAAGSDAEASGD